MKSGCQRLALVGALCAVFLISCGKPDQTKSPRPNTPPRPVRVVRAESQPMERALPVVGTLLAHDDATVSAQVAGQIEKCRVDIGDHVSAGQEIALIDTTSYEALARQSAANLAKATASAANNAKSLQRFQQLEKGGIASTSELERAVADAEQARAEVKAVEATDAIARLNLERSRVKAPFDGAIAERIASVGEYVAAGTPIVRLVKTNPLRLRLEVPEREAVSVRVEQPVRLRIEGDTNIYTGRIARLGPALNEQNRMLVAEADVPNPGSLRAGLFVRAEIIVSERDDALSVPTNSLITFAGLEKVVVVREGKAVEKNVATGRRRQDRVEIVSGLTAGEFVVLDPRGLRTGQPVKVEGQPENTPTEKEAAGSTH